MTVNDICLDCLGYDKIDNWCRRDCYLFDLICTDNFIAAAVMDHYELIKRYVIKNGLIPKLSSCAYRVVSVSD